MDTSTLIFIIAAPAMVALILAWAAHERRMKTARMQRDICLGDDVKTTGGICGTVVSFTDSDVTIESGNKGSEIVVSRDNIAHVSHGTTA